MENKLLIYDRMHEMENKMIWHLNDLCNLRCEYCFFDYYEKENPVVGKYTPLQISEAFRATNRKWSLFIAGGEPFLYPRFNELILLLQQDHEITISTNLFNKRVGVFAEEVAPDNFFVINASLHITQHNERSLSKFISNYHLLKAKGFPIVVSYVTYPPLFQRMESDFEMLRNRGVEDIHPLTFQGSFDGKVYPGSYTDKEIGIFKKLALEEGELIHVTDSMRFKGMSCRAGMGYFYMDTDGEVINCGTIGTSHGNLFEGTFVANSEPIKCPAEKCVDSTCGITSLVVKPRMPEMPNDSGIVAHYLSKVTLLADWLSR